MITSIGCLASNAQLRQRRRLKQGQRPCELCPKGRAKLSQRWLLRRFASKVRIRLRRMLVMPSLIPRASFFEHLLERLPQVDAGLIGKAHQYKEDVAHLFL